MKFRHWLLSLGLLLFIIGGSSAMAYAGEPRITWDPQNVVYPDKTDAAYSVTASGNNLQFEWTVEFGGKDYVIPSQKAALMSAGMSSRCSDIKVESTAHRSTITFVNARYGIDYANGKFTRVSCRAYNDNSASFSSVANVCCTAEGLSDSINNGAGIKVTSAAYYTPNGRCIHGTGLEPDITVEQDSSLEGDEQLLKGIEVLMEKIGN